MRFENSPASAQNLYNWLFKQACPAITEHDESDLYIHFIQDLFV